MLRKEKYMSDKAEIEEEEEVWKTYPKIPFIEVSSFGRVRTKNRYVPSKNGSKRLIKGRVLKQHLLPCGYLYVHFHMNGKQVNLRVHRIVAITFIPNPNNYLEVNHIDNDRINNAVSNLEWCTRQYNNDYRKNFGTSSAQVLGHPVIAVDLKTGKILRFESQSEAARKLGISDSTINMVIKGKLYQTGGYWFTEDESEITEERIREIKSNMWSRQVIVVNPETGEVFWFKSQSEAARQLGIGQGHISDVVKGKQKKTCGHWFCCADKNSVEKVRKKFGDEVAKKVEELMSENQS